MLAFGSIIPVLPKLVEKFLNGDTARAAQVYGVFSMAWAAMQFIFSPLLGAMSDRYGRRPLILLSCFGLGVDFLFMAYAPTLIWLFVGRSEEHTSDIQSLMRISYAVFCLNNKHKTRVLRSNITQ